MNDHNSIHEFDPQLPVTDAAQEIRIDGKGKTAIRSPEQFTTDTDWLVAWWYGEETALLQVELHKDDYVEGWQVVHKRESAE